MIIDEVHHAEAPTYRRVMARLNASFVLGLTATPERGDGIDVAGIFDDNLAHQATIGDGIAEESLVPFHYVGIRDTVDFEQIPWRNGRFDQEELEKTRGTKRAYAALATSDAGTRWPANDRVLLFASPCFVCTRLVAIAWILIRRRLLRSGSDGQIQSLEALSSGQLQTLCVVDMFNVGFRYFLRSTA